MLAQDRDGDDGRTELEEVPVEAAWELLLRRLGGGLSSQIDLSSLVSLF